MILSTMDSISLDVRHQGGWWTVTAQWLGFRAKGEGPTREKATAEAVVALARVVEKR